MEVIVYALNKPMQGEAECVEMGSGDTYVRRTLGRQLTKYVTQWFGGPNNK